LVVWLVIAGYNVSEADIDEAIDSGVQIFSKEVSMQNRFQSLKRKIITNKQKQLWIQLILNKRENGV